jgi:ABC-2 type transport system permease protein
MKMLVIFRRCLREQLRDPMMLLLSLAFAPAMVLLYGLAMSGSTTTFQVLVVNQDEGAVLPDGSLVHAGEEAIAALSSMTYANGAPVLRIRAAASPAEAESLLADRQGIVYLIIPAGFSRSLLDEHGGGSPDSARLRFGGDLTHPYYPVAAILATSRIDQYVQQTTGWFPPVHYEEVALGASGARSEFETYVPGILVFSVIMLVFLASMSVAREVETGTLRRLQLTRMSSFDLLAGISLSLLLMAAVSIFLTLLTAVALGFRSQGPLWVAMLVGSLTALSVMGVGLVVAGLSRSVTQAFIIANFPLGLLMFFSGAVFPLPPVPLGTLLGRTIGLYDVLPPTHAVVALNKVMTLGAGLTDVGYELAMLTILSAAYFAAGVGLFRRAQLRPS